MPTKMSTTLNKLELVRNKGNRELIEEFYQHILSKGSRSERHSNNLLTLLISFDKFLDGKSFIEINNKQQILLFLDHRYLDGKWVKREHDAEGKYVSSWNFYKTLLVIFFRWLSNRDKDRDDWETPAFLKIKSKKALRDSPYGNTEIWERDEVLKIVEYEPETRNKAVITLLWDLDARNHEITALRVGDIILKEQYGQGTIPGDTKTGGGSFLLRCSFPYVRDLLNVHPFKNTPEAHLICNQRNGARIGPETIWHVMKRLRLRIKRLVEGGSITDMEEKQKLEYFLKTKKWNPYCIRHSAMDNDATWMGEHAFSKKVRHIPGSKYTRRYVKRRMSDELKNKILEHDGIKLPIESTIPPALRTCGRCNYVNRFESKYCEKTGCNYPLTQAALDEIKKAEEETIQQLITKSNKEKANEVLALTQRLSNMEDQLGKMYNEMLKAHLTIFHSDLADNEPSRIKEFQYAQSQAMKGLYPKFEDSEKNDD